MLAAAPALAQERPVTLPTRDVDVTYHTTFRSRSFDQRWRFRASDQKLRLDLPAPGTYMIADERAHAAQMVNDGDHTVLQMSLPNIDPGGLRPGQSFTRLDAATVAGLPCTEWQTTDVSGRQTIACLTQDGVLLRARRGSDVLVQAVKVEYGPLDPAAFTVPAGYTSDAGSRRR